MMGTGESLVELCARKPQSERDVLMARAAIQWNLVRLTAKNTLAYRKALAKRFTLDGMKDHNRSRALCRSYLEAHAATRNLIRGLPK